MTMNATPETTTEMLETAIPFEAGNLPGDLDDDEPTLTAAVSGPLADAPAAPEPLPSVAGQSAAEMTSRLNERHQAMTSALGAWAQARGSAGGRFYMGQAADGRVVQFNGEPSAEELREHGISRNRVFTVEGRPVGDPGDGLDQLAQVETEAMNAADELRRHAMAIISATDQAGITLPADVQRQASERYPLIAGQVQALGLPELAQRLRAAVVAEDLAMQSIYVDLLPTRLDSLPDTASQSAKDAAKELRSLIGTIRSQLRDRYSNPETVRLNKRATEMLIAAGSARRQAGKRGLRKRELERAGVAWERLGNGKLLTPVIGADGQPVRDPDGTPLMKRYDESNEDFAARMATEREREQFARNRQTLVNR